MAKCILSSAAAALLVLAAAAASASAASKLPFWPQYPGRQTAVLNGDWLFGFVDGGVADAINFDPSRATTPNKTTVPSAFDVTPPGIEGPKGTAFYRRSFSLPANTEGMLYFAACAFYCQVYIDGKSIGDHRASGYVPFWLDVPASSSETRDLLVLVDNRFNSTTAPTHTGGDFYNYGGITRDVILHTKPSATFLQRVETFTQDLSGKVLVRIVFGGDRISSADVALAFDGGSPSTHTVAVQGGVGEVTVSVPQAKLWTTTSPNLHTLTVSMKSGGSDAIAVRFGLRLVGIEQGRLTLNGVAVKLHGFNRHTMYPDTGSALTLDQVEADVKLLVEVGANYVRGAHYPQDQRFLDLCDEHGIVVWEETLGPGTTTADLTNPYFMQYQLQAVGEMVEASINHPSVILHAFYNEGPSNDKNACVSYNQSAAAVRERVGHPPSRLVTWASNKKDKDVCLDIADVVSFNSYPAWYQEEGNVNYTKVMWGQMVDWMNEHYPAKPFTISETGAGGVYEWTNTTDPMWSQKYQSEVVGSDAQFAMDTDRVSGLTLWQFNDIKANYPDTKECGQCLYKPHPDDLSVPWDCAYINVTCHRPGSENHKGATDFWRRKKSVFDVVKKIYNAAL